MGMIKPTDQPYEISIKDIPRKFIVDGKVDWQIVQQALGLLTNEQLQQALLFIYQSDWQVNYYVNSALLRHAVPALAHGLELPSPTDITEEAPWLSADLYCETCPGSGYIKYGGGYSAPLCGNSDRVERYSDCFKYKENLRAATLDPTLVKPLYDAAIETLQEILNVGENAQKTTQGPGRMDTGSSNGGVDAIETIQGIFRGNSHIRIKE